MMLDAFASNKNMALLQRFMVALGHCRRLVAASKPAPTTPLAWVEALQYDACIEHDIDEHQADAKFLERDDEPCPECGRYGCDGTAAGFAVAARCISTDNKKGAP